MGMATNEKSVLKLVHPGGFVETHRQPITAAEILKKNPRHSITRPDVFKNPWVVVKPESILDPGGVFFIVPNHTIYRLLRAHSEKHQKQQQQQQQQHYSPPSLTQAPEKNQAHRQPGNHRSPRKSDTGKTNKPVKNDRCAQKTFPAMSCIRPFSQELKQGSRYCKKSYQEINEKSSWRSTVSKVRPYRDNYLRSDNHSARQACDGNKCDKEVTFPRSCLKKHDIARKLHRLKVSFVPPVVEDGEE